MLFPKISIIIPVYNVEKYIVKCIESVLNQSYSNLEILLIDDGSLDKSGDICETYGKKNKNVKVFHKENGGLSDARNFGLSKCTGDYVFFLDSDDWINQNTVLKLYLLLKDNKADISECQFLKVYYNDEVRKYNENQNKIHTYIFDGIEASINLRNYKYNQVVSWNKLYTKSLFDDIKFPKGKYHEDEFTTYKILYKCNKIVVTDEKLYYYRQTPNSIMNATFNEKRLDIFLAYEESLEFYTEKKLAFLKYLTLYDYLDIIYNNFLLAEMTGNEDLINKIEKKFEKVYFANFKILKFKKSMIKYLIILIKLRKRKKNAKIC